MWSFFIFVHFLQFPVDMLLSAAEQWRKMYNTFDKVSRDVRWRWCLVFWSVSRRPDGGLQHSQSHFVLDREGPAAHLACRHAPWKKGILYGEDRGIVPHWCMWLLVTVAVATLWYESSAIEVRGDIFKLQKCLKNGNKWLTVQGF